VPEAMYLYIPLFCAALYSFRGDGYNVLLKVAPLILFPCAFVWITPNITNAGILFISLMCLFLFAVWKDWYQISKKLILGISSSGILLMPFAFFGYVYFFGEEYQLARLQAFFVPAALGDYIVNIAKNMRIGSSLIGSSEQSVYYLINGPTTDFLTDYILVSMCSIYGIFLTIAIVVGLLLIVMKIFHISVTQKNQLGMIIGTGCGVAFLIKIIASLLINLQILPYFSISMPFLSYGGSNTFVSYILLGLVLSVYRYKNILPSESKMYKTKRRLRVSVRWETYD
jgi:cell division protein FtsW (lipid II flippase)